jgi:hypothetical protein
MLREESRPHFNQSEIQAHADELESHEDDDVEVFRIAPRTEREPPETEEEDLADYQNQGNNEGELVGYSEQIIGKISDMAPGIPN